MIISNALSGIKGPFVPDALQPYIIQQACCELTPMENVAFQLAFQSLAEYIEHQPLSPEASAIIVYTDKDDVSVLRVGNELGQHVPIAVIWLGHIREHIPRQPLFLQQILLEEVCHTLYQIQNEYKVKEVVYTILRTHIQGLTLHDLYPSMFDEFDHRVPLPEYPDEWLNT